LGFLITVMSTTISRLFAVQNTDRAMPSRPLALISKSPLPEWGRVRPSAIGAKLADQVGPQAVNAARRV
jgi:hypothetical protein